MLRGVSDHQHAVSAESSAASDSGRGRVAGREPGPAPSPAPVLAFGCQNAIALLVELRLRERRHSCRISTCVDRGQPPAAVSERDPDVIISPEALRHTTHCKEQS